MCNMCSGSIVAASVKLFGGSVLGADFVRSPSRQARFFF